MLDGLVSSHPLKWFSKANWDKLFLGKKYGFSLKSSCSEVDSTRRSIVMRLWLVWLLANYILTYIGGTGNILSCLPNRWVSFTILVKASLSSDHRFIVLATVNYDHTVITIVNYDHKTFIVQATDQLHWVSIPCSSLLIQNVFGFVMNDYLAGI